MLRMRRNVFGPVALALVLLATSTALAQEPVVVLCVKSFDALLSDVKYVLSTGGAPQLGDMVDGMLDQVTQGKGLAGVDRKKPLGAYVSLTAAGTPELVVFVPVSDIKAFRQDFLGTFFPRQQEVAGGMFSIQAEGQQFYGKFADGHCFLSLQPFALNKLPDPAKIASSKYSISIEADLSKIPDEVKDALLEQAQGAVATAQEQQKPANEIEARIRERAEKIASQLVRMMIKETDRLSVGIDVDQKSKLVALDVGMVAKSGSPLAAAMASYAKTTSSFGSLAGPEAAASATFAAPISTELRDLYRELIKSAMEQGRAEIDKSDNLKTDAQKQEAKEVLDRVAKVIHATGETGKMDGAVVVNTSNGKVQVIAAGKIAQGDELEKIIEDIVKRHPDEPNVKRVKLNVASHKGARIHAIDPQLKDAPKKYFGDGPAHVAIGSDSVYFAIGGDSLAAVKSAIDKTGTGSGSAKRPPISVRVQPSKLVALVGEGDDPNLKLVRQAFTGEGDHISLELLPMDRGARLRLELGEGFLRLIALAIGQQLGG